MACATDGNRKVAYDVLLRPGDVLGSFTSALPSQCFLRAANRSGNRFAASNHGGITPSRRSIPVFPSLLFFLDLPSAPIVATAALLCVRRQKGYFEEWEAV